MSIIGSGDDDNGGRSNNPDIPGKDDLARSGLSSSSDPSGVPGRRLTNPLGDLSSYTYQISLYMITPDAYDAFVASGRRRINALNEAGGGTDGGGGAFLVAQSGGINNKIERRAPGFVYDYAIDELSFKTLTSGKATQTAANNTTFKFRITEPHGFSFITQLKRAADVLAEYNRQGGWPSNPIRQFFILGIRFLGYDENGTLVDIDNVYEQFYDINITSMKFKLDGGATVYDITAAAQSPREAFGVVRGRINNDKQVEAATVGEAISQLFTKLNVEQEELFNKESIEFKNEYAIRYIGDAREIQEASLLAPSDTEKFRWPGSGARTTAQSNAASEVSSNPETSTRVIKFNKSTPIQEAINTLIVQSSYLRDALRVVYTTAVQPDPQTGEIPEQEPNTKKAVKWYNLSTELSNARWDSKTNSWAYRITYVIQTYETPVVSSPYVNPGKKYYVPLGC